MKPTSKNRMFTYALGFLVMVLAIGLFAGCGDQPLAPTGASDDPVVTTNTGKGDDGTSMGGSVNPAGVVGDITRGLLRAVEKATDKVIGILGGSLDLALPSGGTRFAVPPNAVERAVRIEMDVTQVKVHHRYFTMYEFGPHGLEFKSPSRLTLSLPYQEGTEVSLYWLNPATGQWEVQESKAVRNGKVYFSINHFSKYGIS